MIIEKCFNLERIPNILNRIGLFFDLVLDYFNLDSNSLSTLGSKLGMRSTFEGVLLHGTLNIKYQLNELLSWFITIG